MKYIDFLQSIEEYLYSAMEDFSIDIVIDKGPNARSIQLNLNPFTLVGATTTVRTTNKSYYCLDLA